MKISASMTVLSFGRTFCQLRREQLIIGSSVTPRPSSVLQQPSKWPRWPRPRAKLTCDTAGVRKRITHTATPWTPLLPVARA